jgi:hypothetical protein
MVPRSSTSTSASASSANGVEHLEKSSGAAADVAAARGDQLQKA